VLDATRTPIRPTPNCISYSTTTLLHRAGDVDVLTGRKRQIDRSGFGMIGNRIVGQMVAQSEMVASSALFGRTTRTTAEEEQTIEDGHATSIRGP
jgi:hypothetical protein